MPSPAATERAALCDLFVTVGPDAPTLCGDWTTRDLAAHLIVRERRPDAGVGILVGPFAGYTEKVMDGEKERPWTELVARVRSGPPRWNPMHLEPVDRLVNTVEFFVHHEDVLRAQPGWTARPLDPELEEGLMGMLQRGGRMLVRKAAPLGLVVEPDGHERVALRKGEPTVTIRGPLGECVLYLYGRKDVAEVTLDGPADAVARVREAPFGI
jgi:uncharacterized protein (TIGR03085 family)